MFTLAFWQGAFERAVKTFAQSLIAVLGVSGLTLGTAPWGTALGTAGLAALLSVLTSLATPATVAAPRTPQPPATRD